MKKRPIKPSPVLDAPELAMDCYLSSLLGEATESSGAESSLPVKAKVIEIRPALEPIVEKKALRRTNNTAKVVKPQKLVAEITNTADKIEETEETQSGESKPIIPEWGRQPFQSLLFTVRGMTLAAPLIALTSIAKWGEKLTLMPGQPDWCLGILLHRDERVVVIDTAQLIMPERLARAPADREAGSHVLIIGDGHFGLACDTLQNPVWLETESVRWRRGEGFSPWMAGTVIEKLCVMIDVDAVLDMVQKQ